jgi:hypothetical protein
MKRYKLYLIAMLAVPWLSIPFLGIQAFKRFTPGALFISLFVAAESFVARQKVWWWFFKKLHPKLLGETSLIGGPFFIGSLWILKLTYGHFWRYLIVNLLMDSFFTYTLMDWFKRIGYVSLVRMKKYQLSLTFLVKSLLLYGFQYITENIRHKNKLKA